MVNKFIGIGHLCQDPKIQTLGDKKKASFSVGINNTKDDVLFLNIECWNKVAENCNNFLSKGSCVFLEGKVKTSKWTDKAGNNRTNFYIAADIVRFLPNSKREAPQKKVEKDVPKSSIPDIVTEEEMPF
jgi:single-strand DNA-binding protein